MRDSQMVEMLRKVKKSRIKLDVLDLTKVKKVTAKCFWTELDAMKELNFERPAKKKKAIEDGLAFDVILPGSVTHTMDMEVFFDTDGSIESVNFDPGNSVHDNLCEILERSRIRRNVEFDAT
jgi:hypothetical protein